MNLLQYVTFFVAKFMHNLHDDKINNSIGYAELEKGEVLWTPKNRDEANT